MAAKNRISSSNIHVDLSLVACAIRRELTPRASRVAVGALGALMSLPVVSTANAADSAAPPADELQEIVVTGIRASLKSAQVLKRDADVIQDSINADDIGALPDNSVTETLQRIPGVAINQFAAGNDPDHFSVEGSGVTVRGLDSRTLSLINGRDAFSATNGRGLSFADFPPELLAGVDVVKSPSADMIEGGIAGVVNLRTRLPFDAKGQVISFSAQENYGDFIKKSRPGFTALYSNRWNTGIGDFGVLVDFVDSRLAERGDGTQVANFGCRTDITSGGQPVTSPNVHCPLTGGGTAPGIYFPRGADLTSQDTERQRLGRGGALQWQSPDDSLLATLQYLRSDSKEAWTEHRMEIATDNVASAPDQGGLGADAQPVPGSSFNISPSGVFTNGTITSASTGWRADQFGANRIPVYGPESNNIDRSVIQSYDTEDTSFSLRWNPSDKWSIKLDTQYVYSLTRDLDTTIWGASYQDFNLKLNGSQPPSFTFLPPFSVSQLGANCSTPSNLCPSYLGAASPSYSDPANNFWRAAMDHVEDSDGHEKTARLDFDYKVGEGWIRSLDFGARWSDRNITTRFSTYNWGALSESWGNNGPIWMDTPVGTGAYANGTSPATAPFGFNNFFQGKVPNPVGNQPRPYYLGNTSQNYAQYAAFAQAVVAAWLKQGGSAPITGCGGSGASGWVPLADRCGAIAGTPFLPSEINPIDEKTDAGYFMVKFKNDLGGHNLSGNIGVRVVRTERESVGFNQFPTAGSGFNLTACTPPPPPPGQPPAKLPDYCSYSAAILAGQAAFADGELVPESTKLDYTYVLPNLNIKFDILPNLLARFALSKTVTPPAIGYLRSAYQLGGLAVPKDTNGNDIFLANGSLAPPVGQTQAGNALLKPETSQNVDLSLEWYFSEVGSLTTALFWKELHDTTVVNTFIKNYTTAGATFAEVITQPGNSTAAGKVKGAEFGYRQTYDFLPGILRGLGLDTNYTLLTSNGVPQSILNATSANVGANVLPTVDLTRLPLQGLSKQTFNAAGIYDKGPFSARLAWEWRSRFLLTTRDVIVPYAPIMSENHGQLSASAFYSITPQVKIGFEGANLTDSITRTTQVLNNDLFRVPRSWFISDRRFSAVIRCTF